MSLDQELQNREIFHDHKKNVSIFTENMKKNIQLNKEFLMNG